MTQYIFVTNVGVQLHANMHPACTILFLKQLQISQMMYIHIYIYMCVEQKKLERSTSTMQ